MLSLETARGVTAAALAALIWLLGNHARDTAPGYLLAGAAFVAGVLIMFAVWTACHAIAEAKRQRSKRSRAPAPVRGAA